MRIPTTDAATTGKPATAEEADDGEFMGAERNGSEPPCSNSNSISFNNKEQSFVSKSRNRSQIRTAKAERDVEKMEKVCVNEEKKKKEGIL